MLFCAPQEMGTADNLAHSFEWIYIGIKPLYQCGEWGQWHINFGKPASLVMPKQYWIPYSKRQVIGVWEVMASDVCLQSYITQHGSYSLNGNVLQWSQLFKKVGDTDNERLNCLSCFVLSCTYLCLYFFRPFGRVLNRQPVGRWMTVEPLW